MPRQTFLSDIEALLLGHEHIHMSKYWNPLDADRQLMLSCMRCSPCPFLSEYRLVAWYTTSLPSIIMATGSSSQRIQRKRKQIQDDDPTLPERGTTSHTNIPKRRAIDGETYRRLKINLNAETDSDETIKKEGLTYVWTAVKRALEQDLNFREHLTSEEQFRDNVMRKGEKQFIDSLRSMSLNSKTQGVEAWDALFEDGTSFQVSFGPRNLIVILSV